MNSKEVKHEKEVLEIKKQLLELEHKLKMERMKFDRDSARKFHDMALERERIKSAEIRRSQMRKGKGFNY